MARALGMVTVVVDDYDVAREHYCGAFGFDCVEDTQMGADKRWVVVAPDASTGAALLLARAVTADQRASIGRQTGGRVGFFLYLDDIDAYADRLTAAGVELTGPIRDESYGRVVVARDRYGNLWDLIQRG